MKLKPGEVKGPLKYFGVLLLSILALLLIHFPAMAASAPAAIVDLVLLPASQNITAGSTFTLTIQAQCNGQEVIGVETHLDFDPAYLEIQTVTAGSTLSFPLQNVFDNNSGTLDYAAGKMSAPFPSATFTVAAVIFKVRQTSYGANTAINFHLGDLRSTKVVYGGDAVLRQTTGATVTIPGSPSPTSTSTPTPPPTSAPTSIPAISPTTQPANTVSNTPVITPSQIQTSTPTLPAATAPATTPLIASGLPSNSPSSTPSVRPASSPSLYSPTASSTSSTLATQPGTGSSPSETPGNWGIIAGIIAAIMVVGTIIGIILFRHSRSR